MSMLQMNAAAVELERWLAREEQFGKSPFTTVCVGEFDVESLHYYVFKYRVSFLGDWMLGVSGGYRGDELEPVTDPNSEKKRYDRQSAMEEAKRMVNSRNNVHPVAEEGNVPDVPCGFRPMLRVKQQLSGAECIEILQTVPRGVLSLIGDHGYPYGIPMDHWYCEEDGCLYFHCGKRGHKLDAIRHCAKVSFCVTDDGIRREDDWALTFRSVVVFGKMHIIEDPEKVISVSRSLSLQFTKDEAYIDDEIRRFAAATACLCLVPEHITGKRVHEA